MLAGGAELGWLEPKGSLDSATGFSSLSPTAPRSSHLWGWGEWEHHYCWQSGTWHPAAPAWPGDKDEEVTCSCGHGQKDHQLSGGTGTAALGRKTPNPSSPVVPGATIRTVMSPSTIALGSAALVSAEPSASLLLLRPHDAQSHCHHAATPTVSHPLTLPGFQLLRDRVPARITPVPCAPGDQQYTVALPPCPSSPTAPVQIPWSWSNAGVTKQTAAV